jgi:ribosomal protein S21
MALKNFKQVREETQSVTEGDRPGLWDNIHAKRKRIKAGSGERMRKPGSKGAPSAQDFKDASESVTEAKKGKIKGADGKACWDGYRYNGTTNGKDDCVKVEEAEEMFDLIEDVIEELAKENNVDSDVIWEDLKDIPDEDLFEVAAWQRKEGKNPEGGLNKAGIASYRRENPGSKLQMAVTTKPSKLKPGSKAANRRKSFCARMGGMKKRLTSAKTARDPDSRINKALRKWNC